MNTVPFYEKNSVRITRSLFEVPGTQFPIRNISAVRTNTILPNRQGPIICIIIGILSLPVFIGILIIPLGIYWWISQKNKYVIMLLTAGQDIEGYASIDIDEIREIQSALNAAIAQH
jgi:hypothetical protein